MEHAPAPLLQQHIARWPAPAQQALWACREIFHETARELAVSPLAESLKWGQPAWRPKQPRTGSTLRIGWRADAADKLSLFVDCKTDIAARMREIYPDMGQNDGRREIGIDLTEPLPLQALSHLAGITFAYHLQKRAVTSMG